jgi:hypothetical protein
MARGDHHPRLRQRALAVLLFGLVAVGAGCTGMLQNLGARWATNKISAVFDLDDAQREATRAAVDRAIEAAPELIGPRLDLLVATVDRALAKGLNEQNMRIIERQIDILMDETVGWIIGEAAPILATLRDDQIDHAERELDERLDETREELNAEPTERLESRQEKFVDAIEKWTGRLSSSQTHAIRAQVAAMTDEAADRLRADEKRLGDIANALRAHPDAPAIREILWSAWKQREDWGPGTRSADARRADGRTTLFFVYGLLDDEQKDPMSERLHEMHASVQTLIGTGER